MKQTILKQLVGMAMLILVAMPVVVAMPVSAQDFGVEYGQDLELAEADPQEIMVGIIQVIMTFLAIIAVIMILIGGFKWMTAGGNEDKVTEARKVITAGIIGLVIILSSWAIANWVITTFQSDVLGA